MGKYDREEGETAREIHVSVVNGEPRVVSPSSRWRIVHFKSSVYHLRFDRWILNLDRFRLITRRLH